MTRTSRFSINFIILLCAFLVLLCAFSMVASAQNAPPTMSKGTVTPRKSYPNIDYTFTVTYTDSDNDAPTSVKVYIDGESYDMVEVDPLDRNYTDGKDYSFVKVMDEGSYTIYYSVDDGNGHIVDSSAFTLSVTWDVGHYDIIHFIEDDVVPGVMLLLALLIILMLIFIIVMIFLVFQLRRIAKGMERREDMKKDENTPSKDKSVGNEPEEV